MAVLEVTVQDSALAEFVCKCLFSSWLSIFLSIMENQIFRYGVVKVQTLSPKGKVCDQQCSTLMAGWAGMSWGAWQPLWVGRQILMRDAPV